MDNAEAVESAQLRISDISRGLEEQTRTAVESIGAIVHEVVDNTESLADIAEAIKGLSQQLNEMVQE